VVGDILDISTGGVALQYVGEEPDLEAVDEIRIACSDPPFFLDKIPVKTVSNLTMSKIPFGALMPKRLSLQFGDLTVDQASNLKNYIKDQAVASV
jgi:hypothetical protein